MKNLPENGGSYQGPMSKKTTSNICLYVEGGNPSARDLQNLCAMFEIASVIATVNISLENDNTEYSHFEEKFSDFIDKKYVLPRPEILSSREESNQRKRSHRTGNAGEEIASTGLTNVLDIIRHSRLSRRSKFEDFNEWCATDYGNDLIEITEVNTKNSIELLFNISSIAAIVGFQHVPEIKETVLYIESVFNGWLQKKYSPAENDTIAIPKLPISVERTICQYDEVEISYSKKEWLIKLKRSPEKKKKKS